MTGFAKSPGEFEVMLPVDRVFDLLLVRRSTLVHDAGQRAIDAKYVLLQYDRLVHQTFRQAHETMEQRQVKKPDTWTSKGYTSQAAGFGDPVDLTVRTSEMEFNLAASFIQVLAPLMAH